MPTGYTDAVTRGATFKQFALRCARAFGALVEMMDDGLDIPIPDRFEPSSYYAERLVELHLKLDELTNMTIEEAEIQGHLAFVKAQEERANLTAQNQTTIAAYQKMLDKVYCWTPPTQQHEELKKFMIDQLVSSIKFDDLSLYYKEHPIKELSGADWLRQEKLSLVSNIKYHVKEHEAEIKRTDERNKWIKELRESIKE